MISLSPSDRSRLQTHLRQSAEAIEELLMAGLTTASEATHQILAVTFQEASRMKLLRLGSTLRSTHEEISRYVKDDPRFSSARLMFFLNRSWLLCKGIERALRENDEPSLEKLLWTAQVQPVECLQVICLGIVKKIASGAFCAFEFRLRNLANGMPLSWSTVFPLKPGVEIPAEGYLHLPQKQKFAASVFLEKKVIEIRQALVTEATGTVARIQLTDESQVKTALPYDDWDQWLQWDISASLGRLQQHEISPFDVDLELQEEVVFQDYKLEKPVEDKVRERDVFEVNYREMDFDLIVSHALEGDTTREKLTGLCKKRSALVPMFGLMHYSLGRAVVQPLTLFAESGPQYITLSDKSVDRKTLLSALKF